MILELLTRLFPFLDMSNDEWTREDYEENANPRIFITDQSIWNRYKFERPGIEYTRELQANYEALFKQYREITLYDVGELAERLNNLNFMYGQLLQENGVLRNDRDYYKKIVEELRGVKADRKAELDLRVGRDGQTHRFSNVEEVSSVTKAKVSFIMYDRGYTLDEIGKHLSIKAASVKSYISTCRKFVNVENHDGEKIYFWKDKYLSHEEETQELLLPPKTA